MKKRTFFWFNLKQVEMECLIGKNPLIFFFPCTFGLMKSSEALGLNSRGTDRSILSYQNLLCFSVKETLHVRATSTCPKCTSYSGKKGAKLVQPRATFMNFNLSSLHGSLIKSQLLPPPFGPILSSLNRYYRLSISMHSNQSY